MLRSFIFLTLLTVAVCISGIDSSAAQSNPYPAEIVPFRAGMIVCDTSDEVAELQLLRTKASITGIQERLPDGCGGLKPGMAGMVSVIGQYEDKFVSCDILELNIGMITGPGMVVFIAVKYGFGGVKPKQQILVRTQSL